MGLITIIIVASGIACGVGVYQLVKAKKAVTAGNVVEAVKADAAAVKNDVKKS